MKKKLLSLLSAAALSLSFICSAFPVSAAGSAAVVTASASKTTVQPGDTFSIVYDFTTNPGVTSLAVNMEKYDTDAFEYLGSSQDGATALTGFIFIDGYDDSVPNKDRETPAFAWLTIGSNSNDTGKLLTLNFKVLDGAEDGKTYDFNIYSVDGGTKNASKEKVPCEFVSTKVTVSNPNNIATLDSITVKDKTGKTYSFVEGAFKSDTFDYTVNIPYNVNISDIEVSYTQTVSVSTAKLTTEGNKKIITVTSKSGDVVNKYTITINQQKQTDKPTITASSDPLSRRSGTITIEGKGKIYYTTDGKTPTTASTEYKEPIKVSDLKLADTVETVTVKAIAQDTDEAASEVQSAEFTLTNISGTLSSITINGKSVTPVFSNGVFTYSISYADWKASPTVTVSGKSNDGTVKDPEPAKIEVTNSDDGAEKDFVIIVTNQEGEEIEYTVRIVVTPCEHDYNTEVTKEPTCTATGTKTNTCKVCDKVVTVDIDALGHDWVKADDIAATCEEDGLSYYVCGRANCDEPGVTNNRTIIERLGHRWSDWTTEETDTDVIYTRICQNDSSHVDTVTVPRAEDGHTHSFTTEVSRDDANCIKEGFIEYKCSVEGCEVIFTEKLYKTGHKRSVTETVDATCTKAGYTLAECEICGIELAKAEIPAKGHNFVNGKCTVCGASDPNYTAPTEPSRPSDSLDWSGDYHPAPGIAPAGYGTSSGNTAATEKFNVKVENKITNKSGTAAAEKSGGRVTVTLGTANDGYYANIYTNDDNYVLSSVIENGKVTFINDIGNNFKVVIDEFSHGDDVSSAAGIADTKNPSSAPYIGITFVIAFGASVIFIRKRFTSK